MLEYGKPYQLTKLCKELNIELKKGGKQNKVILNQLKQIYDIEKIDKKYIIHRELTDYEKADNIRYNQAKEYIEPLLYNILSNSENNTILLSLSELAVRLYMVNHKFYSLKYNDELTPENLDYGDITDFIYEVEPILKRIIKSILSDMEDKQLIYYTKSLHYAKIKYTDEGKKYTEVKPCDDIEHFLQVSKTVLNSLGYEKMSDVKYNNLYNINNLIANKLNIDYFYNKYDITINRLGIKQTLESYEYKQLTNKYISNKLSNSKQGILKRLDDDVKDNIVKLVIDIE